MPLTDLNIVRLLVFSFVLGPNLIPMLSTAFGQQQPTMTDPGLKVEVVAEGLDFPTSMSFLESDDILVLEKDDGKVERIIDGTRSESPILDVPVVSNGERGLLGSAVTSGENDRYLFLFYTESPTSYDIENSSQDSLPLGNRLYRYEIKDDRLINPKLLLDLPADVPAAAIPFHTGGKVIIGPDEYIYLVIGDLESRRTQAQNIQDGPEPDGTGVIYKITQDGESVDNAPLGVTDPIDKFYAYGIRNSFGMDFDPVTGILWDTENGPTYGDEINMVEAGFNSGSLDIHGMSSDYDISILDSLVDFDGKGRYSEPEFTWKVPVGVTALKFIDSDKYGENYENDMLVADVNYGNIYHFELNKNRTGLSLEGELKDKIADGPEQLNNDILLGTGFGGITDIEIGPDGYIYVLAIHRFHEDNTGSIFRIVPVSE
jgi:glucose/arabinose dehydrogenase